MCANFRIPQRQQSKLQTPNETAPGQNLRKTTAQSVEERGEKGGAIEKALPTFVRQHIPLPIGHLVAVADVDQSFGALCFAVKPDAGKTCWTRKHCPNLLVRDEDLAILRCPEWSIVARQKDAGLRLLKHAGMVESNEELICVVLLGSAIDWSGVLGT